jgi:hypothetical protein
MRMVKNPTCILSYVFVSLRCVMFCLEAHVFLCLREP